MVIDANVSTAAGYVASLATANGVITATGTAAVDGATYVLTGTAGSGTGNTKVTWAETGTCVAAGFC